MDGFAIGMIITGAVGVLCVVFGFYMLSGRGSFLIAGYNTMPKEEKEKYDIKGLCKFIGRKILIPVGLLTVFFAVGLTIGVQDNNTVLWFTIIAYTIIVLALSVFAVVYLNTGNRFRK